MLRMSAALARAAGRISRSTGLGAGSSLPGQVALRLSRRPLEHLSQGRQVALISGTNGKTTTTSLLASALSVGQPVATNHRGSNLETGLITAMLETGPRTAVLEVDEVVLPRAVAACRPAVVLLLNLSRDQLDRTSEVAVHAERWGRCLAGSTFVVVANADDPLVAHAVFLARPTGSQVVWVAAGRPWRRDTPLCPRCHAAWEIDAALWRCDRCGLQRPHPDWTLQGRLLLGPSRLRLPLALSLPGRANGANAAMAIAAAETLGVEPTAALEAMSQVAAVVGRYAIYQRGRHRVRLLLAKNPAGWHEVLAVLAATSDPLIVMFGAKAADGTDPSWLWDVPFEQLSGRRVEVTGSRGADLATRLDYADVPHRVHRTLAQAINGLPDGDCDVVANYTSFVAATDWLTRAS